MESTSVPGDTPDWRPLSVEAPVLHATELLHVKNGYSAGTSSENTLPRADPVIYLAFQAIPPAGYRAPPSKLILPTTLQPQPAGHSR